MRGEGRKTKALDKAKEAVAQGFASVTDFDIAANGVVMDTNGKIVPASAQSNSQSNAEDPKISYRMDISIHNIADHP